MDGVTTEQRRVVRFSDRSSVVEKNECEWKVHTVTVSSRKDIATCQQPRDTMSRHGA